MPRPGSDTEELRWRCQRRWGPRLRWKCVYCGRRAEQVDHFQPSGRYRDRAPNLVPACGSCNSHKRQHDPVKWMKAVGVPAKRIQVLLAIINDPTFRAPANLNISRVTLDYDAWKPHRAVSGQLG